MCNRTGHEYPDGVIDSLAFDLGGPAALIKTVPTFDSNDLLGANASAAQKLLDRDATCFGQRVCASFRASRITRVPPNALNAPNVHENASQVFSVPLARSVSRWRSGLPNLAGLSCSALRIRIHSARERACCTISTKTFRVSAGPLTSRKNPMRVPRMPSWVFKRM